MKKLLLSLAAVVGLGFAANAKQVTDVLDYTSLGITKTTVSGDITGFASGAEYYINAGAGTADDGFFTMNSGTYRLVTTKSPGKVVSVSVVWSTEANASRSLYIYSSDEAYTSSTTFPSGTPRTSAIAYSTSGGSYTFTTQPAYVGFNGSGGNTNIKTLSITWEIEGEDDAVEAPTFAVTKGTENYSVTISCATDGADIYYTTNGDEPSDASTKYDAPIVLASNTTTTIKAIAILGEDQSSVASTTVVVPMLTSSLAELIEGMMDGEDFDFVYTGNLTYVYKGVSGTYAYLYLTDGTDIVLVYGYASNMTDIEAGTTFTSLEGTAKLYNGLPEITNPTFGGQGTGGENVQPTTITTIEGNIDADHLNAYYEITGVNITNNGGSMEDADGNTVTLYNRFGIEIDDAEGVSVRGFVSMYSTTLQFYPTYIEAGSYVFDPVFSLEDGEYAEGTEVTISCPTEGATIVYQINDGDILEQLAPVTIVLTEDMTIEAWAQKEGLTDSDVVKAEYTVKIVQIEGTESKFDFTTAGFQTSWVEPLNDDFTYPTSNIQNFAGKYVFVNNGVELSFGKGTNNNNNVCMYTTSNGTLRTYTGNTVTVTLLNSKYYFTSIKVGFGSSNKGAFTGLTDGEWTATERDIRQVVLTTSSNTQVVSLTANFTDDTDGVESVVVDENAPVEYFNLQGVRVAEPAAGLYIRRQGDKVEKVVVR